MADAKISALTASTTPLAGTEVLPIVQGGATKKVSVADLTAGRAISATELTVTTGNVIIGTSGKGIDFSATSGTGTSELFADYEEGTWTPIYSQGVTSPIYASTNGHYVKIGSAVYITLRIQLSGGTANANQLIIDGLPFTTGSGTGIQGAFTIGYQGSFKTDGNILFMVGGASTVINVWNFSGAAFLGTDATNITATLHISGFYIV